MVRARKPPIETMARRWRIGNDRPTGKSQNWPETFKKVKIASTDWDIKRNGLGILTKRTITVHGYSTTPDGLSQVQSFVFRQDYDGAKYAKAVKYDGVVPDSQELVDGE